MYSLSDVLNLASQHISSPDSTPPTFRPASKPWMDNLFGFNDLKDHHNSIFKDSNNTIQKIAIIRKIFDSQYNPINGILNTSQGNYRAGWFVAPTVKEIKDMVGSLHHIKKGSAEGTVIKGMDVGLAHVNAEPLEVFQGASQLNALEMVDIDVIPNDGINIYVNDPTQGPRTAIACASGTLVRNYWLPMIYGSQYNMLENLKISHTNGYLLWGTEPESVIVKMHGFEDNIRISSMLYTQVSGITVKKEGYIEHQSNKLMHQIYSSAAPMNTYRNGGNVQKQEQINRLLLTAQYIGIIGLSLILHYYDSINKRTTLTKPRVNLTLVGGGVFNVSQNIIFESIQKAITYYDGYSFELYIHGYESHTATAISQYFNIPIGSLGPLKQTYHLNSQSTLSDRSLGSLNRQIGVLPFPSNFSHRYLVAITNNGRSKFYAPRNYQLKMLQELYKSPHDRLNYKAFDDNKYPIHAILIKEYDKELKHRFKFINDSKETIYYVDVTIPPVTYYSQNPDSTWSLYDQYNQVINTWPL